MALRTFHRLKVIIAFGLPLLATAILLGLAGSQPVDDAYISLRTANNLAEGRGPVFNPGQRVLGVSNIFWTGLLATCDLALPARLMPRAASALAGIFLLAAALLLALRLRRDGASPLGVFVAATLIGTDHRLIEYCAAGMETGLLVFVIALCLYLQGRKRHEPWLLVAGLLPLVRPEAFILWPALMLAVPEDKALWRVERLALLFVPPLAFAALAWLYFGTFVPSSVSAKAVMHRVHWAQAIRALLTFTARFGVAESPVTALAEMGRFAAVPLGLVVNLGIVAFAAVTVRGRSVARFGLAGLAITLAFLAVTRPLTLGWHLAGAEFCFALVYAVAAEQAFLRTSARTRTAVAVALVTIVVLTQFSHLRLASDFPGDRVRLASRQHTNRVREHLYTMIGRKLAARRPDLPTLAATEIGAIGTAYGGPILDLGGLISPEVVPFAEGDVRPALSPEVLDRFKPAFLVTMDVLDMGLLSSTQVERDYRVILAIPVTLFGGRRMVVLERIANRPHFSGPDLDI